MNHLHVQIDAAVAPASALAILWRPQTFRAFWPHVECFEVGYDDGAHQHGAMTVLRDGAEETIHLVRMRQADRIVFANPVPPASMASHRGEWRVSARGEAGCTLHARRWYELARAKDEATGEFLERSLVFAKRFQTRLERLLESFAAYVGQAPATLQAAQE